VDEDDRLCASQRLIDFRKSCDDAACLVGQGQIMQSGAPQQIGDGVS
jgi:hypothetical protein